MASLLRSGGPGGEGGAADGEADSEEYESKYDRNAMRDNLLALKESIYQWWDISR